MRDRASNVPFSSQTDSLQRECRRTMRGSPLRQPLLHILPGFGGMRLPLPVIDFASDDSSRYTLVRVRLWYTGGTWSTDNILSEGQGDESGGPQGSIAGKGGEELMEADQAVRAACTHMTSARQGMRRFARDEDGQRSGMDVNMSLGLQ